jgi:hypothetical protein
MSDSLIELQVPYPEGTDIRDFLSQPELAQYPKEQVSVIVLSSRRLSDIMPYLHKPAQKPTAPSKLPGGSLFRGMVFGNIGIYTNRSIERDQARVLVNPAAAPPPKRTGPPPRQVATASGPKHAVKMVGMPGSKPAQAEEEETADAPDPAAGAPAEAAEPTPAEPGSPSREKVKRWTEIIPSGTRVRRPEYPGDTADVLPGSQPSAPSSPPEQAPAAAPPADAAPIDPVRLAKEVYRLITGMIPLLEKAQDLSYERRSDLAAEMRMLQLELDKFQPGIVRITDMIMNVSDVTITQKYVARLKECLRDLGLLL